MFSVAGRQWVCGDGGYIGGYIETFLFVSSESATMLGACASFSILRIYENLGIIFFILLIRMLRPREAVNSSR